MIKVDEIGEWSERKLGILGEYLKQYSLIMNKQRHWLYEYSYIDGFSGTVTPLSRMTKHYVMGSPMRALTTVPTFDRFFFIEKNRKRAEAIRQLKNKFPERDIDILKGDSNQILTEHLIPYFSTGRPKRGFVFLDPYGLQVRWEVVQELAISKKFDVFINFPIMGIARLMCKGELPPKHHAEKITAVMGTDAWQNRVYSESRQLSLFGDRPIVRQFNPIGWITDLYVKNLKHLFPYVTQPIIMKNSRNSPIYALILASHKEPAERIMRHIFSKYDR